MIHNYTTQNGLESEDAFLAGLTLGNLFAQNAEARLDSILRSITAENSGILSPEDYLSGRLKIYIRNCEMKDPSLL